MQCLFVFALLLNVASSAIALAVRTGDSPVSIPILRIEGSTTTIYEGPIPDYGMNVTTPSGGTHLCDGTNNGVNAKPAGTCTGALNEASKLAGFTFDGTWDPEFVDYFITRIASDAETSTEFWGLLLNYQFTAVGGCQQEVKTGDQILWAFNAFNVEYFLKLTGPVLAVTGESITVTVTDGTTNTPIVGAAVGGVTTGTGGKATLKFQEVGIQKLKASAPNSIRSNELLVVVI